MGSEKLVIVVLTSDFLNFSCENILVLKNFKI